VSESVARSWGCQDSGGLSVSLVRKGDQLTITINVPAGLLDLDAFIPAANNQAPADRGPDSDAGG
jgi:hypothetical protein